MKLIYSLTVLATLTLALPTNVPKTWFRKPLTADQIAAGAEKGSISTAGKFAIAGGSLAGAGAVTGAVMIPIHEKAKDNAKSEAAPVAGAASSFATVRTA